MGFPTDGRRDEMELPISRQYRNFIFSAKRVLSLILVKRAIDHPPSTLKMADLRGPWDHRFVESMLPSLKKARRLMAQAANRMVVGSDPAPIKLRIRREKLKRAQRGIPGLRAIFCGSSRSRTGFAVTTNALIRCTSFEIPLFSAPLLSTVAFLVRRNRLTL